MAKSRIRVLSLTLRRLRGSVLMCCWLIGLCLAVHVVVWSLSTFTEMRYDSLVAEESAEESMVIVHSQAPGVPSQIGGIATSKPPEPGLSRSDSVFRSAHLFASGIGPLALLALIPIIGLGVILSTGTALPGCQHTASAFSWAIVLALIVLPVGRIMGLPFGNGIFVPYDEMVSMVEGYRTGTGDQSVLMFFSRCMLFPAACIVGILITGLRFAVGVEGAMVPLDEFKLDPAIEKEASNIKATSHHGGRTMHALSAAIKKAENGNGKKNAPVDKPEPSIARTNPGSHPGRLKF